MAKPRKPKPEEPKQANSAAAVRHQKLCLSIDTDLRRIYGYTELEIEVPDIGIVGLHAENLGIDSVFVDGEATVFEYYPHSQSAEAENRWASVSSPGSAADALGAFYLSTLEKELVPNLLINCCNKVQVEQMNLENGVQELDEVKQNVKSVRVNYWVDKAETGIHFEDNVVHTDNQIRRARCWFPCIDNDDHRCCYDLEFTVSLNQVAVSNGTLLYQVLSNDDPPRKVYVYKLDVPVTARWISLAVGPFEILPDQHNMLISHMCLSPNMSSLRNSVEFFHSAFSEYEEYLDARFPFGSYKQVFLPPEMVISSSTLGASFGIFSSQVLYDEKVIDQTIDTCIKLAFALARQWFGVYVTPESPDDEWLLDGLAGFMTDLFIKKYLGNNEARFRRYKANLAVCKADDSGATALSFSGACKDLYRTNSLGIYGKIRSWKSVAILQMLEKQMGPDFFKKILQTIVSRAQSAASPLRTLSTKEFRHFANKIGNLERPFLKEFFPRWVGSHGCPLLRMGFSYNKRKNIVELAVLRECTATIDSSTSHMNGNQDSENRDGDIGWPGVMTIRVYELDCMSDHPDLPLAGDPWQLIEIPCHSKLAAKRFQRPKKGAKPDISDDNVDMPAADVRTSMESPLSWIRADPEMEYLAEIHMNQPVHMWMNQLEKDEDVVAQAQAIASLESLPQLPFSVVNALNNFLNDSKAFWRIRIEAAYALANTTSEENDFSGLQHLIKFYKSRRIDADIGLPKPNDFRDFAEYFVLEAIPSAIAMVRATDKKSPREAVEFILQLLKYNDNNGNPYSDVFWLAALVESTGELEFGHESILLLTSLLKCIDRLLQFDRLMPSYNGILTSSCIQTLTQIALKLSGFICLDHIVDLIKPFRGSSTIWHICLEASKALLDIEFHSKGIDAALLLFVKFMAEEPSLRGQVKLSVHIMRLCQLRSAYSSDSGIKTSTLLTMLELFESRKGFNNVFLRHHLFCIIQLLAGRAPTLYGVPRDKLRIATPDACIEQRNIFGSIGIEAKPPEQPTDISNAPPENAPVPEASKEVDTISSNHERKAGVVKIRVKQSSGAGKPDEADNRTTERSQAGPLETEHGASSSVSVDAPQRNSAEAVSICNQNLEEVDSFHDRGSRITASIGSAKVASEGDNLGKELQCTADSSKVSAHLLLDATSSPSALHDNNVDTDAQKFASLQNLSTGKQGDGSSGQPGSLSLGKDDKSLKKKDKEKKRKHEDPEYLEKKKLKKERKRKEKEIAKLLQAETKTAPDIKPEPSTKPTIVQLKPKEKEIAELLQPVGKAVPSEMPGMGEDGDIKAASVQVKAIEPGGSEVLVSRVERKTEQGTGTSASKLRIRFIKKFT